MKAYFSILQVPLREEAGEKLSLGLLLREGDTIFFHYSNKKLRLLKALLPTQAFRLLTHSLRDIAHLFENQQEVQAGLQFRLLENSSTAEQFSQESYISYLSQYNNNLLTFTPPAPLGLSANPTVYEQLYRKLVADELNPSVEEPQKWVVKEFLTDRFYPKVEERVNIEVELGYEQLPTLFLPLKVSFIGKNDAPVVGKEIDFSKRSYDLEVDLTRIYTLVKAFEETGEGKGTYYAVGQEPPKSMEKNHRIWKTIYKAPTVEFVDYRESDKIVSFIEEHNVLPFLPSPSE